MTLDEMFGPAQEWLQQQRLALALRRDDCLTEAEQVAVLDVYAECGR